MMTKKTGIACTGHWVIDYVKFINNWPGPCEICNINSQIVSNGGAPFNILADLSYLAVKMPLYGVGCIGNDPKGLQIMDICKSRNISTEFLHIIEGEQTSYTDVMTVENSGMRTMFHFHGVNKLFSRKHVPMDFFHQQNVKLFYLGHLLLMDALEEKDPEYSIAAARLLHDAKSAGMETVVDIATEKNPQRYRDIVVPCLPYIDHFVINELEAQKISGIQTRTEHDKPTLRGLKEASRILLDAGVRKNIIIHMPEGAYWLGKEQKKGMWHPSFSVPKAEIRATCGAGDAFCAGTLVGLHENWPMEKTLHLAVATAAASVTSIHNSDGILPVKKTMALSDKYVPRSDIKYY